MFRNIMYNILQTAPEKLCKSTSNNEINCHNKSTDNCHIKTEQDIDKHDIRTPQW